MKTKIMGLSNDYRMTGQQLELLKSFRYLRNQESINDVRELLSLYYEHKLDAAIKKAGSDRNYTKEIYESWLNRQRTKST